MSAQRVLIVTSRSLSPWYSVHTPKHTGSGCASLSVYFHPASAWFSANTCRHPESELGIQSPLCQVLKNHERVTWWAEASVSSLAEWGQEHRYEAEPWERAILLVKTIERQCFLMLRHSCYILGLKEPKWNNGRESDLQAVKVPYTHWYWLLSATCGRLELIY